MWVFCFCQRTLFRCQGRRPYLSELGGVGNAVHAAKTAIQRAEDCVPVADPEAWRSFAVYNPLNGITEYPERFKD